MLKALMSKVWSPSGNAEADDSYVRATKLIQAGRFDEAEALLQNAVDGGNASAMHNLALLYKNGMASRFDLDEAISLFSLASSSGHQRAAAEHRILTAHRENPQQAVVDLQVLVQNFNRGGGDGTFINAAAEIVYAGLTQSGSWPDEAIAWVYSELEEIEAVDQGTHDAFMEHHGIGPNESMMGMPLYDLFSATTARRLTAQIGDVMGVLEEDGHNPRVLLFTRCSILGRVIQRANLYPAKPLWGLKRFVK